MAICFLQADISFGGHVPVWGINAITLQPTTGAAPSAANLLTNHCAVSLNRFYRAGGIRLPATPTECRVTYNRTNLLVLFRCTESDMAFPAIRHGTNWFSLLHSPFEQDAVFPDKVDLFVQPHLGQRSYYQFTATLEGLQFGCQRKDHPSQTVEDGGAPAYAKAVGNFEASVTRQTNAWVALFRIPWKTLGGKPKSDFGLLPIRTRWRDGEVSSPVAFDFTERPPLDLFIETHLGSEALIEASQTTNLTNGFPSMVGRVTPSAPFLKAPNRGAHGVARPTRAMSDATNLIRRDSTLYRLPSGALRWQRPAVLYYPDAETVQRIWRMEQSLSRPADRTNFAERLYLTQCWIDLLTLEGFNFQAGNGSIAKKGMEPDVARGEINAALRGRRMRRACRFLDRFLDKLDETSRDWFADGSPGDVLKAEWSPVSKLDGVERRGNVLLMHGRARDQRVDLHLSLPATGGIRIYGDRQGYFRPADLLPLHVVQSSNAYSVETADGRIIINKSPFAISFYGTSAKQFSGGCSVQPAAGHSFRGAASTLQLLQDLAFRFNSQGEIMAVDFKNRLAASEVIYGFGEKYDHFNEHGHVLTLWGIDDWYGNTVGLMNQSYKSVPIMQSSKGYMLFDNSTYRLRADIGRTDPNQFRLTQQGPIFDYYFWVAPPKKAIESYTALTGKPILPPKWAFEPWMGRTGLGWSSGPLHDAVAQEERAVEHSEKLDIPHSAIYSEGPGADSRALNQFMTAHDLKVLSWFFPSISQSTQEKLMPELKPAQLPLLRARTKDIPWPLVDFTNPNALELCRRWWRHRLEIGVAGSMVDFGDRVPEDAEFYNGEGGDEMHNFYSYDYHKTINEVFREKRGSNFILFARAAAPGTQKWAAQFAGDHPANFGGLRAVLTGALNLCACGFSTWGSDLGGFLGWPEPTVYMRWTQLACFSPLMRCHGRTPREPWNYGQAAVANYQYYAWVRENLLNYIYHAAIVAHETGIPIMRSLAVAYPDQPDLAAVGDEYMFGSDLLVAPIISESNSRTVCFPAGQWTSLWDGKTVSGPARVNVHVALNRIPVYLKQGAVLPVQLNPSLEFGQSMTHGRVNALILTPPIKEENVSLLNSQSQEANVISRPASGGFAIKLNNLPQTSFLLLYDAAVAAVRVDGKTLPKLEGTRLVSMPAGWREDPVANRLVIRLPASRSPGREVEVELKRKS